MSIVEIARKQVLNSMMNGSFTTSWESTYSRRILQILGDDPTEDTLRELGGKLGDVFTIRDTTGSQSERAIGGYHWENLCIWYLNALAFGTRTVAVSRSTRAKLIPKPILNAFDVHHRGELIRELSDPFLVSIPSTSRIPKFNPALPESALRSEFPEYVLRNADSIRLTLLSCKTNCSDVIKEPMLWNLVYSPGFSHPFIEVGHGDWTPSAFGHVTTALITTPVGDFSSWKPTHAQCRRARTFTGGAYWGQPSSKGLGFLSIDRIFNSKTLLASRESLGTAFIQDYDTPELRTSFGL